MLTADAAKLWDVSNSTLQQEGEIFFLKPTNYIFIPRSFNLKGVGRALFVREHIKYENL